MPKRLVVVVPSVMRRLEDWSTLIERVQGLDGYGADVADWFLLDHRATLSTRRSATSLAATVAAEIHQRVQSRGPFEDVVLVGHSLGGMLVRSAYVQARLAAADERNPQWPWLVTRIVLFASLNRGMEVSRHRRWWLPLVFWFARVLPWVRGFLLHDLLRGSAFVSSLRIEWIRIMSSGRAVPLVVQHLGTEDDLVTAQESTDIETFPTGRTVSLPGATHGDLVHLESASDPDGRFALIRPAFADPVPAAAPVGDPEQQVVLLLHGIRASNEDWAAGLRDEITRTWPRALVSASEYGRFSARQFVLPATRRKFLGWLQDEYAEALARNPLARFYFVGHSNGTYLFGRSLLAVPAMRFERVLLVGQRAAARVRLARALRHRAGRRAAQRPRLHRRPRRGAVRDAPRARDDRRGNRRRRRVRLGGGRPHQARGALPPWRPQPRPAAGEPAVPRALRHHRRPHAARRTWSRGVPAGSARW